MGYYLDSKSRSAAEKRPFLTQEQPSHEANKRLAVAPDNNESLIKESSSDDIDAEPVEPLDATRLQHLLLSFEKKITKNQQMRVKFADDPEKFMESEIALHDEVSQLLAVAASPELFPLLVSLGSVKSILGVLTHENTDISLAVLALLQELTDPDTLQTESEEEMRGGQVLLDALVAEQGLELVVQNLGRLDDKVEEDSLGIGQSLTILENVIDVHMKYFLTSYTNNYFRGTGTLLYTLVL